jgi:hypothetical protein
VVAVGLGAPANARADGDSAVRAALDRLGLTGSAAFDYYSSNHDIDDREHFPGLNLVLKQRLKLASGVRWVAEARVLAQQVGPEHEDATHARRGACVTPTR